MKIGHKLTLGFMGLTLLIAAIGYVALSASRDILEKTFGESSAVLAAQTLDRIQNNILNRIETIQAYSKDELAKEYISQSNSQFELLPDPDGYIEQIENDWDCLGNELTPFMTQLSANKLAGELKSKRDFYNNKYGYPLFAEIFITNRFGANIAQTNKTNDYYQADELWWQQARDNGRFVSDIDYDISSDTFSTAIAVRIDNSNGDFSGVIKAVLNIRETVDIIDQAKAASEYKTLLLHLINNDGKILYSTSGFDFFQDANSALFPDWQSLGLPGRKCFVTSRKAGEKEILYAHAHTKSTGQFDGQGWVLLTGTETAEIFAPIAELKRTLLLAGLSIMSLALLAGTVIYRSITVPIAQLRKATIQVSQGNLDTNLTSTSTDEIGQLAGSFQKMAQQLKKTIADLNAEIAVRKKAETGLCESEGQLRTILENVQTGIFIIDPETHTIVDANSVAEKLVGIPLNQLVGSVCHKYICTAEKGRCPITDLNQIVDNSERKLLTGGGEECPIIKTVTTIAFKGKKHLLESFVDISERKKAEQAMEKLNKDLETTIAELSRSNRQLQDFVHIAAHDLKTPVRGIGTLADWIINDYGDWFDEQGREQIRLLKTRVLRIDKLIDGMLQFSKIARNRPKEHHVDLNGLMKTVIGKIKPAENIEIAADSLPPINCQREHAELLFESIISNAVTFMDKPKGLIKVGCLEQGDFWKFYIQDNGPGIEQKHFERIFKIFQTLPGKDTPQTAGVGLAVARKIVEIYGGKIWVESQPGTGSIFFFTFSKKWEEPVYADAKAYSAY